MPGKIGRRKPKQAKKVVGVVDLAALMNRMHQLNMTQKDLADKLNSRVGELNIRRQFGKPEIDYDPSQISLMLNKKREIKLHEFLIISSLLGLPPQEFLTEKFKTLFLF